MPVSTKVFTMILYLYRGTYGGCFSTTLGALVHELGHSLDLGHTENGIMARGFDDMDRFFSICPNTTATQCTILYQLILTHVKLRSHKLLAS